MKEKTINENNEKLIAQAEENAEAVEMAEVTEETAEENNEISLTSNDDADEVVVPEMEDFEMHNAFIGNEYVSPVSGGLTYKKTLFTMKGLGGFDLPITLSYNSTDAQTVYYDSNHPYKIAQGWYLCFDGIIYNNHAAGTKENNASFKFADGSSYKILNNNYGIYLQRYTRNDIDINFQRAIWANGVTETFNAYGGISTLTDRFGNGYIFEYNQNVLTKIKSINNESDYISFNRISYSKLEIFYEAKRFEIDITDGRISSIKDADGFLTQFEYTLHNGEYCYFVYDSQFNMSLPQTADYYPLTSVVYPTGGKRKYTYKMKSILGASYGAYAVEKAELHDDSAIIDTVTYTYQGDTYNATDIIKINDFEGYPLSYVFKSAQVDNGKTITYYNFGERGEKMAEEVYIKGNPQPHIKIIYEGFSHGLNPTKITTGYFDGIEWKTEIEEYRYEPYHDLIKSRTDKAGRVTTYTYDTPQNVNGGYCLLKSESYQGITKTNEISQDSKQILSTETVFPDKTTKITYTYASGFPCNVTSEIKTVSVGTNPEQQISKVCYSYDFTFKFPSHKTISDISSNLSDNPYSYSNITNTYMYDLFGRLNHTDEGGRLTYYEYDCSGRLKSKKIEGYSTMSIDYSNLATERYCIKSEEFSGKVYKKKYCFDSLGRTIKEINMLNLDNGEYNEYTVNEYEYTGKNLTKVTSGLGFFTVYTYDAFDRVVSQKVYNSAGTLQNEKSVIYDDFNRTKTTVSDTLFEKVYLDEVGRKTTVESGYIKTENDVEIYEVTLTTLYTYDNFDRILTTTVTDNSLSLAESNPETRVLTTTNTYSSDGNLLSVTDPMGNRTEYTYNLWNKVATVKYPNNSVYTYTYDTIGRLTKETDPNNKSVITLYDRDSNVTKKIDKMGHEFTYSYDIMNRLVTDGNGTTYTYFGNSAVSSMTDTTGTTNYTYDINGRLITKATPFGTMSFTYYDNGLVKLIRDYNGARITHYYDDFGRLARITRTTYGENATSATPVIYTYNNFGQLSKAQYPKGKIEYTYDNRHRLIKESFYTGVRNSSVEPTNVKNIIYSYDSFGNIISRTTTKPDANNSESIEVLNDETFEYDNLFRLVTYVSTPLAEQYTYDCMGNRLTKAYTDNVENTSGNVAYTYNNINQLLTETKTENDETVYSYTYTYDDNGNMLNDPKTGDTYGYDYYFNKLSSIFKNNNESFQYFYNGKGELIERDRYRNDGFDINRYMWDESGFMINEEEHVGIDSTEYTVNYSNLVSLNGIFARYTENEPTYLMKNSHGDVVYTQWELETIDNYDYDAFGNLLSNDPKDGNPFRYCGEYFDVHSGTYYLRNRYYNPRLGRFTTIDPIKDGHNWYVYCGNNPIMCIDPFGMEVTSLRELVSTSIDGSIYIPDGADYAMVKAYGSEVKVYFDPNKNDYNMININGTLYLEREEFLRMMNVDAVITTSGEYEIDVLEAALRQSMYNASISAAMLIVGKEVSKVIPPEVLVKAGAMVAVIEATSDAFNISPFVEIEPGTYTEEHFIIRYGENIHSMTVSTLYSDEQFPQYTRTSSYIMGQGMTWEERVAEIKNIYGDNMIRLYRK